MARITVQNLTYRFDNSETLFSELNFTLDNKVTGLVGRNGVGKSILASLLAGEKHPYAGSVTRLCHVGLLSQIGADNQFLQHETISDFLSVKEKLLALERITQGGCELADFDLIGDRWRLREEIEQQLLSLGVNSDLSLPCQALSGGQLTRLALHQLFKSGYGYLILDEPGNHLDEQGKRWLIEQIELFSGGVLIISHNRDILRCVDNILELSSLGLRHYGGSYDLYAQQCADELSSQEQQIEQAKNQIRQIRQTVQKNREKAQQRAGQGKKLSRSGSQAKILLSSKKQNAERSGGSRENSQNRQLAQAQDQLSLLTQQHESLKQQNLSLGRSEKRSSRTLDLIAVKLPYCTEKKITLSIDFGDKMHLVGPNGCGKSTLLKTITRQLQPIQGEIKVRAHLCYLDQHFTLLEGSKSVLDNLETLCPHLTETEQRTLCAGIGLPRDRVDQTVATLSGGEKMKLAMLAISHQPGNILLLLDEPDNHLDLDSKQLLARALRNFSGSLLVVSHDQDFIKEIGISSQISLE